MVFLTGIKDWLRKRPQNRKLTARRAQFQIAVMQLWRKVLTLLLLVAWVVRW